MEANKINKKEILDSVFNGFFLTKLDRRKANVRLAIGTFGVDELKRIEAKRIDRALRRGSGNKITFQDMIFVIRSYKNAPENYRKILIRGNSRIYWASPAYGHRDYNKSVFGLITPRNLHRMDVINNYIQK